MFGKIQRIMMQLYLHIHACSYSWNSQTSALCSLSFLWTGLVHGSYIFQVLTYMFIRKFTSYASKSLGQHSV